MGLVSLNFSKRGGKGQIVRPSVSPHVRPRPSIPDSEVPAKPKRRRFTADYKRSIVEQADAGLYTHGDLIGSGETGGRSVRQIQSCRQKLQSAQMRYNLNPA
jgi:hypothetical protein